MHLIIHFRTNELGLTPPPKRLHFNDVKKGNAAYLRHIKEPNVARVLPLSDMQYNEIYGIKAGRD